MSRQDVATWNRIPGYPSKPTVPALAPQEEARLPLEEALSHCNQPQALVDGDMSRGRRGEETQEGMAKCRESGQQNLEMEDRGKMCTP